VKHAFLALACAFLFSACGYHLIGQSGETSVIPKGATELVVIAVGGGGDNLLPVARKMLTQREGLALASRETAGDTAVELRIEQASESLTATSFDTAGIANQYRLTVTGAVRLIYQNEEVWHSELITVAGDLFATGGSVAIEAQKERLAQSLRKQWSEKMIQQLHSGF